VSGQGTGTTVLGTDFASLDVHRAIDLFLARESELLDSRRYWEWADLVEDDFTYQVPVPRTPDNPFSPHYDDRTMLIDESRWSLTQQWFRRPDDPDLLDVRSNVLLVGVRQSDLPKYVTAERFDTVVRRDDDYRLRRRWAVLDETVIDFPQLRILL